MNNGNLWGLRILALVLAIGIWWVISVDKREPSSEKVIEATVTYDVPKGFMVLNPEDTVRVRMRGTRSDILKINPLLIDAVVQIDEAAAGSQQIRLGPENIFGPRNVEVVSVEPNVLSLILDREATGMLPVSATLVGEPAAGAIVRDADVLPGQVLVRGPQTRLRQTTGLGTTPVDLTGHALDFEEQAAVISPDPLITIVSPAVVTVRIPMEIPGAGGGDPSSSFLGNPGN